MEIFTSNDYSGITLCNFPRWGGVTILCAQQPRPLNKTITLLLLLLLNTILPNFRLTGYVKPLHTTLSTLLPNLWRGVREGRHTIDMDASSSEFIAVSLPLEKI